MIRKILFTLIFGVSTSTANAYNFVDYGVGGIASYWTYQNTVNPSDTYTNTVFDPFIFNGHQAVKFGDPSSYEIVKNDGSFFHLYGHGDNTSNTAYPGNISLGVITDGMTYQTDPTSLTSLTMVRIWDNLDATQKAAYNIDPTLTNLLLFVGFDAKYTSNSQNAVVESNLSGTFPDYAVTHLDWWKPGVGNIIDTDVSALTGVIGTRYNLVSYNITPSSVPVPSAVWLFGSAIAGFFGFNRRKTTQQ